MINFLWERISSPYWQKNNYYRAVKRERKSKPNGDHGATSNRRTRLKSLRMARRSRMTEAARNSPEGDVQHR
jgi:hypothetical protein